ncbi:hypothetical protein CK203_057645 [Vitis vinifera]|uniref:Reverse transcriptase domain-containing protein n=1 Tax=Vitis vinifera TaxID=29760 RepID=A0A438GVQ8_VITVI|nr:hypothetical protein CK203_057645 [Vitis vinifera]
MPKRGKNIGIRKVFSVLVNGSLSGFFQSSKGAKEGAFIDGFFIRGRNGLGVEVPHLLFAYDTLILCDASKENLEYLSWIFMWFEAISRLKVNLEKSELILVGDVSNLKELAGIFGCKVGALPTTYFGLPLGAPHKSYKVWEGVEERFQKRFALWKRQFLSKGKDKL